MRIATSRVTTKGHVHIPTEIREKLSIKPGAEVVWDVRDNGEVVVRPKRYTLRDAQNVLNHGPDIKLTDEEIQEAKRELWLRHSETASE